MQKNGNQAQNTCIGSLDSKPITFMDSLESGILQIKISRALHHG